MALRCRRNPGCAGTLKHIAGASRRAPQLRHCDGPAPSTPVWVRMYDGNHAMDKHIGVRWRLAALAWGAMAASAAMAQSPAAPARQQPAGVVRDHRTGEPADVRDHRSGRWEDHRSGTAGGDPSGPRTSEHVRVQEPGNGSAPRTRRQSFWTTVPGVLTGIGGIMAGIAALVTALRARRGN
jgi:hypothetical protein